MCMYLWIYVYVCLYKCVFKYSCIYVCINMHMFIYINIYLCLEKKKKAKEMEALKQIFETVSSGLDLQAGQTNPPDISLDLKYSALLINVERADDSFQTTGLELQLSPKTHATTTIPSNALHEIILSLTLERTGRYVINRWSKQ